MGGFKAKGERVIRRKKRPTSSLAKTSRKDRSEISGSFHMKARRDEIAGSTAPTQKEPKKHVRGPRGIVDFGGELTIATKGLKAADRREIREMIANEGERAAGRDPANKVLRVTAVKDVLIVHTAKNNLAVAIGKKLHRARKGGKLTVTWSHHDMPVRATWTPPRSV